MDIQKWMTSTAARVIYCGMALGVMFVLCGCWEGKLTKVKPAIELKQEISTQEFSYFLPKAWNIKKQTADEIIATGPTLPAPYLSLVIEPNLEVSLDKSIDAFLENSKEEITDFTFLEKQSFITNSKLEGRKCVATCKESFVKLVVISYHFESTNHTLYCFNGVVQLKNKEHYEPIFDAVAKSFILK